MSTLVMMGVSYVWHGVVLTDIADMSMALGTYFTLTSIAYVVIGLTMTLVMHFLIARKWISLKVGFTVKAMAVGALFAFPVYLGALVLGFSSASRGVDHMVVDLVWQVVEQAMGGLLVSLGIIYDMHRNFMEAEQAR